jgi:hypothetical protein
MVDHLRENFPFHYSQWGPQTARAIVGFATRKAESYGLSTQREICLYLTLLPSLGASFDQNPLLPWATEVLRDSAIRESRVRIERLVGRAMEFLDACQGKKDERLVEWATTVKQQWPRMIPEACRGELQSGAALLLKKSFPEKFARVPESALRDLFEEAVGKSQFYEIRSPAGIVVYTALLFLLGWRFDEDPQLPTLAQILRQPVQPGSGAPKERRLYEAFIALVDRFLAWKEKGAVNG